MRESYRELTAIEFIYGYEYGKNNGSLIVFAPIKAKVRPGAVWTGSPEHTRFNLFDSRVK